VFVGFIVWGTENSPAWVVLGGNNGGSQRECLAKGMTRSRESKTLAKKNGVGDFGQSALYRAQMTGSKREHCLTPIWRRRGKTGGQAACETTYRYWK